ncbi:unnamed protein product [Heligmosomoides polygyrus]|uniref:TOG domain-containing protein n=1 Tax=Heligmosomoides polygyrus TaxID=6339 RepID=A0A183F525_HELPZ|nr:unnamed protein product [Heligmosomoides polygyrus]
MDEWDLLDEVDVIALWPSEHKKNVESGKWQERKESLELMDKNPRLSSATMTIYGELMDNLKKIIAHDSNINVVIAALNVVTRLARGLRERFACFISMMWVPMLDKAKDKKATVRAALGDALDAVSDACAPDRLAKDLCEHLVKPNPTSKQCLCSFLTRYFVRQMTVSMEFTKAVVPVAVKLASDSDPAVRDAACSALGSARRLLGRGLDAFLAPLVSEKAKLDKVRLEAVDSLLSIMESAPRVAMSPELQMVMSTLVKVLEKDVNINVSSTAAKVLAKMAASMRTDFAVMIMPIAFDKLKEKKAVLRNELVGLCDAASTTVRFLVFFLLWNNDCFVPVRTPYIVDHIPRFFYNILQVRLAVDS